MLYEVITRAAAKLTANRVMQRVAILLFHPHYGTSRVGRSMANALAAVDGITISDVYARYPDFV